LLLSVSLRNSSTLVPRAQRRRNRISNSQNLHLCGISQSTFSDYPQIKEHLSISPLQTSFECCRSANPYSLFSQVSTANEISSKGVFIFSQIHPFSLAQSSFYCLVSSLLEGLSCTFLSGHQLDIRFPSGVCHFLFYS